MSTATAPPGKIAPAAQPPSRWVKRALSNRIIWIGLAVWIIFSAAIPLLAHGVIPFDQPMIATLPYQMRVMIEVFGPVVAFIFIAVVYVLTRRRVMDIADRAPERSIALRETLGLLAYGALVMIGGMIVGNLAGTHRIGLHLAGSMFGISDSVTPREVGIWTFYNFAFYAAIPYLWFRRRGYSREQLCLKSTNPLNDTIVILVILAVGLAFDLPGNALWKLNGRQLAAGGTLTFISSFLGTGLPIMIFLTSILVPRFQKLTGSTAGTCVLGGFTYATLHLTECWTRYDTPAHAALSVVFIILFFAGPGMVKSYLTLRTGNAWVHLWGYHVIWPHVTGDTPLFVKIFSIR